MVVAQEAVNTSLDVPTSRENSVDYHAKVVAALQVSLSVCDRLRASHFVFTREPIVAHDVEIVLGAGSTRHTPQLFWGLILFMLSFWLQGFFLPPWSGLATSLPRLCGLTAEFAGASRHLRHSLQQWEWGKDVAT